MSRSLIGVLASVLLPCSVTSNSVLQFDIENRAESDRAHMTALRNNMTLDDALSVLSGNSEVMSLVQKNIGHHVVSGQQRHLRNQRIMSAVDGDGADKAKKMLNEMIEEAMEKLDAERVRCSEFEIKMRQLMEESKQSIAAFNAASNKARAEVLEANAQIETLSGQIKSVEESFSVFLHQCAVDDAEMAHQLSIIADDVEIMGQLAKKSACDGKNGVIKPPAFIQCINEDGQSFLGFGHKVLREKVMQLQSDSLRQGVQELLWEHGRGSGTKITAVGDHDFQSFVRNPFPSAHELSFLQQEDDEEAEEDDDETDVAANQTAKKLTPKEKKKLARKCSMSKNPNCRKINDKFLLLQAEVLGTQSEWKTKRVNAQTICDKQEENFKAQLNNLGARLKIQQTALAKGTEAQNEADEQHRLESIEFEKLSKEFGKGMRECKKNIKSHTAEECSLTKLRLEVFASDYVVDCQVGDWKGRRCSKKCGGGIQRLTRKVTAHPVGGGAACPALIMERSCNEQQCPTDCKVGSWEGWSTCSADCDGGVMSRSRPVEVDSAHGGEPCGETSQTEGCNSQACNQPCELGRWEPWSPCGSECGGGFRYRNRPIEVAAVGSGACPKADDAERMEYETCNNQPCPDPTNGTYTCEAKLDVILLLDGSGSLGPDGWKAVQKIGSMLANSLVGGDDKIQLAVQVFSGPGTYEGLYDCLGYTDKTPDMDADCNVKWVQRLSKKTDKIAKKIESFPWPGRTTLTSAALALAEAELKFSRKDAQSVVICITDGVPMDEYSTALAAYNLRDKARLMFVPVGGGAPRQGINQWASSPIHNNVIDVEDFETLGSPNTIDKIILDMCPNAM